MNYFLGIDSGGTKTEFTLADETGVIVGRSRMGTTHYQQVGIEGLVENLEAGIDELLQTSGLDYHQIYRVFLGLAAYGEILADMEKMDQAVQKSLHGIRYTIGGDNHCAWAGSLAGQSGCNIVAGTGSIAYAQNNQGQNARCGGWGHWFGGDEGSAYWIGCQLLLAFAHQSDGREKRTSLYEATKAYYHITDDFDIINLVVNRWSMDRSKVATLSKFAYELAEKGDDCCRGIFQRAGKQLAEIVNACIRQIPFQGAIPVSYSGGVFKSGELVLQSFRSALMEGAVLTAPVYSPSVGAIILAMMHAGYTITPEIRFNLAQNG